MPALLAMRFAQSRYCAADLERAMWEGIDKALLALGAASPTSALSEGFDSRVDTIDGFSTHSRWNRQPASRDASKRPTGCASVMADGRNW
jgi:hypothetical protein